MTEHDKLRVRDVADLLRSVIATIGNGKEISDKDAEYVRKKVNKQLQQTWFSLIYFKLASRI